MFAMGSIRKEKIPGMKVDTIHIEESNFVLAKRGEETNKLHLIVDMSRIGAGLFNVKMEYTYFAPRSGRNNLFELVLMKWPKPNALFWSICSFPIEYRPQAELVAKECGLRLADGIPTIFDSDGAHQFPLDGPTVYTLENIFGHQAYDNDRNTYDKLKQEEHEAIDAIVNADRIKLFSEMIDQGYSPNQIDRILNHWESGDESYNEIPERHKNPL
jgi:hypothetical protein